MSSEDPRVPPIGGQNESDSPGWDVTELDRLYEKVTGFPREEITAKRLKKAFRKCRLCKVRYKTKTKEEIKEHVMSHCGEDVQFNTRHNQFLVGSGCAIARTHASTKFDPVFFTNSCLSSDVVRASICQFDVAQSTRSSTGIEDIRVCSSSRLEASLENVKCSSNTELDQANDKGSVDEHNDSLSMTTLKDRSLSPKHVQEEYSKEEIGLHDTKLSEHQCRSAGKQLLNMVDLSIASDISLPVPREDDADIDDTFVSIAVVPDDDPAIISSDSCGENVSKAQYCKENSEFEIDVSDILVSGPDLTLRNDSLNHQGEMENNPNFDQQKTKGTKASDGAFPSVISALSATVVLPHYSPIYDKSLTGVIASRKVTGSMSRGAETREPLRTSTKDKNEVEPVVSPRMTRSRSQGLTPAPTTPKKSTRSRTPAPLNRSIRETTSIIRCPTQDRQRTKTPVLSVPKDKKEKETNVSPRMTRSRSRGLTPAPITPKKNTMSRTPAPENRSIRASISIIRCPKQDRRRSKTPVRSMPKDIKEKEANVSPRMTRSRSRGLTPAPITPKKTTRSRTPAPENRSIRAITPTSRRSQRDTICSKTKTVRSSMPSQTPRDRSRTRNVSDKKIQNGNPPSAPVDNRQERLRGRSTERKATTTSERRITRSMSRSRIESPEKTLTRKSATTKPPLEVASASSRVRSLSAIRREELAKKEKEKACVVDSNIVSLLPTPRRNRSKDERRSDARPITVQKALEIWPRFRFEGPQPDDPSDDMKKVWQTLLKTNRCLLCTHKHKNGHRIHFEDNSGTGDMMESMISHLLICHAFDENVRPVIDGFWYIAWQGATKLESRIPKFLFNGRKGVLTCSSCSGPTPRTFPSYCALKDHFLVCSSMEAGERLEQCSMCRVQFKCKNDTNASIKRICHFLSTHMRENEAEPEIKQLSSIIDLRTVAPFLDVEASLKLVKSGVEKGVICCAKCSGKSFKDLYSLKRHCCSFHVKMDVTGNETAKDFKVADLWKGEEHDCLISTSRCFRCSVGVLFDPRLYPCVTQAAAHVIRNHADDESVVEEVKKMMKEEKYDVAENYPFLDFASSVVVSRTNKRKTFICAMCGGSCSPTLQSIAGHAVKRHNYKGPEAARMIKYVEEHYRGRYSKQKPSKGTQPVGRPKRERDKDEIIMPLAKRPKYEESIQKIVDKLETGKSYKRPSWLLSTGSSDDDNAHRSTEVASDLDFQEPFYISTPVKKIEEIRIDDSIELPDKRPQKKANLLQSVLKPSHPPPKSTLFDKTIVVEDDDSDEKSHNASPQKAAPHSVTKDSVEQENVSVGGGTLRKKNLKEPMISILNCAICDEECESKETIQEHAKKHRKERIYRCAHCRDTFFSWPLARAHERRTHNW